MLDPLLVEVDLDLWQLRGRFTLEFECNIYCQKLSDALLKGFLPDHASINILSVTTFVRHLFRKYTIMDTASAQNVFERPLSFSLDLAISITVLFFFYILYFVY
jgi:hypothetical protein